MKQKRQAKQANVMKVDGGVTSHCLGISSVKEAFELFINEKVKNIIIEHTNYKGNKVYKDKWKEVDSIELEAFFGLLFASNLMHLQNYSIDNLFRQQSLFHIPVFAATTSRDRFKQLLNAIRFDNEETRFLRGTDKLFLIREVTDLLVQNFKKMFIPFDHVTIDEQLMPFRGNTNLY